ncbi:MAG TPA: response regulator [Paraburkholderia sp.]|uniref:response regulator transcription factor n=1 Tax=Paraburkholderia sp. TaxID=1926495 RepID=UPI002C1D9B4B|nr:response regulator [Paraburkholderia sp.]HTR09629.1 response regulator [Paraburkholderia sp.]
MAKRNAYVAVVDDDESVGRAIKRLLRSFGIDADTYLSGEAFLDTLASQQGRRPDCVILDIQMPGMNGLDVLERLDGSGIPVIFVTAHDDEDTRQKALTSSAVGYLCKPFDDSVLFSMVQAALGKTSGP